MESLKEKYHHIKGWGIDQDPQNNPNYPIRTEENKASTLPRPVQQTPKVEILQSIERTQPAAVIGTTLPPSGCSGPIRRLAFRYSESEYSHWLLLLLADRVQLVEGWVSDLKEGQFPTLYHIKNQKIYWHHHQVRRVKKLALLGLGLWLFTQMFKRK
jgi:hypothetical protein